MGIRFNKRSFFYSAFLLSSSGIILQIMGFFYRIYLSRMIGAEALGLYRLIFPVNLLFVSMTLSGIRIAVMQISAELTAPKDAGEIHNLVRVCFQIFTCLFSIIFIIILLFHSSIAENILGDARVSPALWILPLSLFLYSFQAIFEALFIGTKRTKFIAFSNILEQSLQITATLLLLYHFADSSDLSISVSIIMFGGVISGLPIAFFLLWSYRKNFYPATRANASSSEMLNRVTRIALPICASSVCTSLFSAACIIILPKRLILSGMETTDALSALGIISGMAFPLISFPLLFITSMSSVLMPNISASHSAQNWKNIKRKIQKSFQMTSLFALPITAFLLPLIPHLMSLLYKQDIPDSYIVLLSLASSLMYFEIISSSILNGLGMQNKVVFHTILGVILQFTVTYILCANVSFQIFGYLLAMVFSPFLITSLNIRSIYQKTGVLPQTLPCFVFPGICALIMGVFSHNLHSFFLNLTGHELLSVLLALVFDFLFYSQLLPLTGVHPLRYFQTITYQEKKDFSSRLS